MDGRGACETPPLSEELLTDDCGRQRESLFSSGLWPRRDDLGCGRWTDAHAQTASTKWGRELDSSIQKQHMELGGESGGG